MSWALFTLDTLVDDWGRECQVCKGTNKGEHDSLGVYNPPSDLWTISFGVIATMTSNVLMPAELGAYASQDMYFVTRENCQVGIWVKDGDRVYKIHERAAFSWFDQTDLFIYKMKLDDGRLDKSDAQ